MEQSRAKVLKRLNSMYKAGLWTGVGICAFVTISGTIAGGLIAGIVGLFIGAIVVAVVLATTLPKYKKAMKCVRENNPVICTVTGAGTERISNRRSYQAAYFLYENKECFGFDYEKMVHEIIPGQQLYVWKITDKQYEIIHID